MRRAIMKIGFIGLGNMGSAMAINLLKAGHDLTVYNRTADKTTPLLKQGARAAANPGEASCGDVVFTMLAVESKPCLRSHRVGSLICSFARAIRQPWCARPRWLRD